MKRQTTASTTGRERFSLALIEPAALALLDRARGYLSGLGVRAYVVGGLIRDGLLGRETADVDLVVSGDALEAARGLARLLGGTFVLLDAVNKVGRVVLKGGGIETLDVAALAGKTIGSDLRRRDFTVDAMAVDLHDLTAGAGSVSLIDPFGGRDDVDRGIVRAVSDTAFRADPVRLLRAVRMAVELGFEIAPATRSLIRGSAPLVAGVPGERVREELLRLLAASRGGRFLMDMDEIGLLMALIPELAATRGVSQPVEHHWDVLIHSIMTVSAVDFLLHEGTWGFPPAGILDAVPWSDACARHFEGGVAGGSTRRSLLKLAALFHDIAKPQTKAPDKSGRTRFLGHPEQGAEIASGIMERLRFSTRETKLVSTMVRYHLRPTQMGEPPTGRAIYRYFRDTADAGIDILYLSLADHLATRGPELMVAGWKAHADVVRFVLDEHFKKKAIEPPPKLVDGHDLMRIFGLKPGPRLGKLLEVVKEAQAAGELTTREQALEYIRRTVVKGR